MSSTTAASIATATTPGTAPDAASPILYSLLAGLSTGIGGLATFFSDQISNSVMAAVYALAAGVMLAVSVIEFLRPSDGNFAHSIIWAAVGMIGVLMLRAVLPEEHDDIINVTEKRLLDTESEVDRKKIVDAYRGRQLRLGLIMMGTLTLHNLPEGMAVTVATLNSSQTGFQVMLAIAVHNIPEGLAIAMPIYAATGSRWKAIACTLASGMSEPLGAAISTILLRSYVSEAFVENSSFVVGGIMSAVAIFELWPESWRRNKHAYSALSFVMGWVIMVVTVQYA
jgi:ZIP family zinc transporter